MKKPGLSSQLTLLFHWSQSVFQSANTYIDHESGGVHSIAHAIGRLASNECGNWLSPPFSTSMLNLSSRFNSCVFTWISHFFHQDLAQLSPPFSYASANRRRHAMNRRGIWPFTNQIDPTDAIYRSENFSI